MRLIPKIAVVGVGNVGALTEKILRCVGADVDDAAGFQNGQRAQEQRVGQAENRGVGTNSQRQRYDGDQREPRILDQYADGEAQVLDDGWHWLSLHWRTLEEKVCSDRSRSTPTAVSCK